MTKLRASGEPGLCQGSLNFLRSQRCWWVSTMGSMAVLSFFSAAGLAAANRPPAARAAVCCRKSRRLGKDFTVSLRGCAPVTNHRGTENTEETQGKNEEIFVC